jgi:WD40 repeat protein
MARKSLSREAVGRNFASLRDNLGRADQTRMDALATLIGSDGRIRLSEALNRTFPDQSRETALALFRQLRGRVSAAAAEVGVEFSLETDRQTRTEPKERWCWFKGQDSAADAAARLTGEETSGVTRSQQNAQELDISGKRLVRYFVCYAHEDRKLKDDLLGRLRHFFGSAKEYRFLGWEDGDIELGSDWHEQIQRAVAACDFGLLLVSPAFLCSSYIGQDELPHFVAADPFRLTQQKRAAPVALKPIRLDGSMDLKGLERRQIFYDSNGKAYGSQTGLRQKDDFTNQIFGKIVQMLATSPPDVPQRQDSTPREAADRRSVRDLGKSLRKHLDKDLADIHFVRTQGRASTQDKLEADAQTGERRDALKFLTDWAIDPKGQPYCALLGEYGMGKTTTSMAFAQALLEAREKPRAANAPPVPLPIYLDLRHLGEGAKAEPGLLQIVETVLQRSWRGGLADAPLTAEEVVRLVQQDGAIAIFDGLDEVLVHLSPAAGQRFTREVFRILPPALSLRRRRADAPGRPGRVLVTCRTHYFRTLREQKTHLTAQDRDDVRVDDYRVFVLLPFTDQQVRAYLKQTLPGEDIDRVIDTIGAVHNLPELAERPFTLSLITRQIPEIERWRLEGRRVSGVDLYRHMVLSWLERDAGKHQITPDHKQQIMEHFAASLWRSGKQAWSVGNIEQWLIDFMRSRPEFAAHYDGKDRELLKEDLRTATFLVREGEADFRFAHTSLLEFFLAGYLHRALIEGRIDDWDLPSPSPETVDFLGQLLRGRDAGAAIETLRTIRGAYRPRVSELALAYVLASQDKGYPAPSPAGFQLAGADLRRWTIAGSVGGPALNLRGASFRGARLAGAVLRNVDLENADLSGADLMRGGVVECRARGARFAGTGLIGTIFHDVNLDNAEFAGARFYRSQFLKCQLVGAQGLDASPPAAVFALCHPARQFTCVPAATARLAVLDGHARPIRGCAFSFDGARIASASDDGSVRIWDAASGECLMELGHKDEVNDCAFSPDGTRIASVSDDRIVRIWDATSGQSVAELGGHQNFVMGCAFSLDGTRVASASYDRSVRIWDAASGECVGVLRGHSDAVNGCAFSPDGTRVASASDDRIARIWDATSGECVAKLRGHNGEVYDCAFSPDGTRVASASYDRSVRIWDAASGECVGVLRGHSDAVNGCAFSPDGTRVASASRDETVRIWDAASGDCVAELRGHKGAVNDCTFSSDGSRVASSSDDAVRVWDAASGEYIAMLDGRQDLIVDCAVSPDGARIASAVHKRTVLWDAASGECVAELHGHQSFVTGCAFSPDGTRVASASRDETVRIWDAASGKCVAILRGHKGEVNGCAFSPDRARVASASNDRTVCIWDVDSGECLMNLRGHKGEVNGCAFSPDGTRVASAACDRTVRIWDALSGKCVSVLRGHQNWVMGCAFSPDGTRVVSASDDHSVHIWDVASGKCITKLQGHQSLVNACAFSPDGARVASASCDQTVRIWDGTSGECVAVFRGHQSLVMGCAFSPDGTRVVSASFDGTLRLWDVASAHEIGPRWQFFNEESWLSVDLKANRIIQIFGDAWRWLGWLAPGPTGTMIRYPAETFGPLPEFKPHPAQKAEIRQSSAT